MELPWSIYPRPQMQRDSYFCLNGEWEFAVLPASKSVSHTDEKPDSDVPDRFPEHITVPYAPQSRLSGIGRALASSDVLYYRRKITLPETFTNQLLLLHIGAADQTADVYWDGIHIGHHVGGYLPFTLELGLCLQDMLSAEHELVIRIEDTLDHTYPYGKQRIHHGGMWYTPVSGLWQTVWMEAVCEHYIRSISITPQKNRVEFILDTDMLLDDVQFTVSSPICFSDSSSDRSGAPTSISPEQTSLCDITRIADGNHFVLTPNEVRYWTPEEPFLYYVTIHAGEDCIRTYFALRTLEICTIDGIARLCLNGKPYFFHGLLDQGYFHDGIFLPETPDAYTKDIRTMKELGFNMLRKHIKIEPDCYYYDCDRLGMAVFQDFVNNSDYSFIRDTALPTIGIQRLPKLLLSRKKTAKECFIEHSRQTVKHLYNHPCICLWTIFNEGWGQFDADTLYSMVRSLDGTRWIDSTSGWFRETKSDVESRHVYFKRLKPVSSDKPFILSEFGGYCIAVEGHLYDPKKAYGYHTCATKDIFMDELESLYLNQLAPLISTGLCASVYTQLSDVEEEINGLFTYDRAVLKVDRKRMLAIAKVLH